MARTGFYPGSFDPVTYGHLDIIARAARLVDRLVLGVGVHHGKQALIAADDRIALLENVSRPIAEHAGVKISVVTFENGPPIDAPIAIRLTGQNLLDSSKDEVFDKFGSLADQASRDYDEYELETERAGPVFQVVARWAF